jgi:hypothetical protein
MAASLQQCVVELLPEGVTPADAACLCSGQLLPTPLLPNVLVAAGAVEYPALTTLNKNSV